MKELVRCLKDIAGAGFGVDKSLIKMVPENSRNNVQPYEFVLADSFDEREYFEVVEYEDYNFTEPVDEQAARVDVRKRPILIAVSEKKFP